MPIRYIANLTFEEQIHHWENGNSEEMKLGAWLRKQHGEMENDAADSYERGLQDGREEGYDNGYSDAMDEVA
ncbi:MAG TPA: hypothetical protein VHQ87_15005 [Rhizobacter sp.]|jgi:flagellar biosynthesis/type III secretory pathway protein FliH|nr:hypothetical protein [Rhizobacter sp.]